MEKSRPASASVFLAGAALFALGLVSETRATQVTQSPPPLPSFATADSNGSMIAVTGIDVTGGSLLYLVDTEARQLAVYQATGGTESTRNVAFVGARNIDLDLQLDGYNDRSEFKYKDLEAEFAKQAKQEGGR